MSLFGKILEKLGLRKDQDEEESTKGAAGATANKPTGTAPKTPANPKPAGTARTTTTARPGTSRGTGGASATTTGMGSGSVNQGPQGATRQPVGTTGTAAPPAAPKAMSEVDVMNMLEQKAKGSGLNWKQSISDLLFLLDLDNSREARKELAEELGAPAEVMGDSARMNTWLHKEVLRRIAANGGNIPREMLD